MKEYRVRILNILKFETMSIVGRIFYRWQPPQVNGKSHLNLGCGEKYANGMVNADFYRLPIFLGRSKTKLDWMLDIRYPLRCQEEKWDGVFSEHTLEHLYPDQAKNLLKELYRTMKKGAVLRITVPDLRKYIDFYTEKENKHYPEFSKRFDTGAEAIRNISQNYYHFSLWDSEQIFKILSEVGFREIRKVSYCEGENKELLQDSKERKWETLYVEAKK